MKTRKKLAKEFLTKDQYKNFKLDCKKSRLKTLVEEEIFLNTAFIWADSSNGYQYWSSIDRALSNRRITTIGI